MVEYGNTEYLFLFLRRNKKPGVKKCYKVFCIAVYGVYLVRQVLVTGS